MIELNRRKVRQQKEREELGVAKGEKYSRSGLTELPGIQGTFMELTGNRRLEIDGCKGILEYGMETIRVNASRMVVKVTGRGLMIKCMTRDSVSIEGYIATVEFTTT